VEKVIELEVPILSSSITTVDTAQDLGVILDHHLTISYVSALCRSAYCFLCQLRQVVRSVSADASMTVVHAFISSHLDYCNCLLCSSAYSPYRMLQHTWSLTPKGVTTLPWSFSNYPGSQLSTTLVSRICNSQWSLSSLSWSTSCSTTWHHRIFQTVTSWLPPPGAASFDHLTISSTLSLVPVHVLEIDHLLLPDHASGTFLAANYNENLFACSLC